MPKQHAKTAPSTDRPARGPRRPIHQQPRRRWALSSTAMLALRPAHPSAATPPLGPLLDRSAGTEAAHLRLQHGAAYFKAQVKAPRQAGSKTASRAAHNQSMQPTFSNKCDDHRACYFEAAGTTAAACFPALTCLTRRSLGSDRHLGPFVPL